ncbi:MarR family transcriptional regulator [Curtobacterium sp. PhB136]|uniref:MarR family winged helix-turn-helix transcriptional regulator n=1 Tax=Curtobacterium sp. PhB136 TaxID=2485181 RepID=UPI0010D7BD19|nr:MarR family transcriptional regulator [Curtobacterium sp. PhB136]TCK65806.1 MarR family transcriptional regulator [Curtobacterium sp. PhB136]
MVSTDRSEVLRLENQVCFALVLASRGMIALYQPLLEPLGITHPQYLAMLALWERNPRTIKDLGEALQLTPATLSPLVKRLEALGLIDRRPNSNDPRQLDITVTEAGMDLLDQAETIPGRIAELLRMENAQLLELYNILHTTIKAERRALDSDLP